MSLVGNKNEIHPIIKEDIQNILSESLPWTNLQNKTVLVTGATGLIPGYIVHLLMSIKNVRVIALSRSEEKLKQKFSMYAENKHFKYLAYDISIPTDLNKLFSAGIQVDIIFHGAGNTDNSGRIDRINTLNVNIIGAINCLEYLKNITGGVFVPFSSVSVFGTTNSSIVQENDYGYINLMADDAPYTQAKRTVEVYSYSYYKQFGINVFVPRIPNVIGPGIIRGNGLRSDFTYNVYDGKDIIINSDGKKIFAFSYISDVVLAMFHILFFGKTGEPYNIVANNGNISVKDFAKLHTMISGVNTQLIVKGQISDDKNPGIMMDNSKLSSIGWKSKVTIADGLQRIYNYMLSQNKQGM